MRFGVTLAVLLLFAAPADAGEPEDPPPASEPSPVNPGQARAQRFAARLSANEPLYFALGWREGTNAKFQISFAYRFLNPEGSASARFSSLRHLYFGYTQTSLWDLESESKPFYDTSYRPSLFMFHDHVAGSASGHRELGYQLGLEHESNGQGGEESRSLNIAFVTPIVTWNDVLGGRLRLAPKIYAYLGDLKENPDLADYRGWVDLKVDWIDPDGLGVSATLRKGNEDGYGSIQLDLSYPLDRLFGGNIASYIQLQYFNGWGESLLSYDRRLPSQIRIGLMAVR